MAFIQVSCICIARYIRMWTSGIWLVEVSSHVGICIGRYIGGKLYGIWIGKYMYIGGEVLMYMNSSI